MRSRVVVVLPTESYRVADFVDAARNLGVELSVASEHTLPLVPVDRQVLIDCADPQRSAEQVADLATSTPIDAIIAADDSGVEIAARASALVGLSSSPVAAVRATLDKAIMRGLLAAGEISQPEFAVADLDSASTAASSLGYPVVVKPRTRTASVGVVRADTPDELAEAAEIAEAHQVADDGTRTFLIESFVPGPEISVEGMIWNGRLEILAIFDKPDQPDGPYFPETIFVTPSELDASTVGDVERAVANATSALGLTDGPIHAELRIRSGEVPVVIEVAARTIGGLCGRSLSFGLMGDSLESLVIRQALGLRKPGSTRIPGASGVMMLPVTDRGELISVNGVDRARSVDGVTSVEMTSPLGSKLEPAPHGDRYLGFVFARGADRQSVIGALHQAAAQIEIEIG